MLGLGGFMAPPAGWVPPVDINGIPIPALNPTVVLGAFATMIPAAVAKIINPVASAIAIAQQCLDIGAGDEKEFNLHITDMWGVPVLAGGSEVVNFISLNPNIGGFLVDDEIVGEISMTVTDLLTENPIYKAIEDGTHMIMSLVMSEVCI